MILTVTGVSRFPDFTYPKPENQYIIEFGKLYNFYNLTKIFSELVKTVSPSDKIDLPS
jgi:hypothetical protein